MPLSIELQQRHSYRHSLLPLLSQVPNSVYQFSRPILWGFCVVVLVCFFLTLLYWLQSGHMPRCIFQAWQTVVESPPGQHCTQTLWHTQLTAIEPNQLRCPHTTRVTMLRSNAHRSCFQMFYTGSVDTFFLYNADLALTSGIFKEKKNRKVNKYEPTSWYWRE